MIQILYSRDGLRYLFAPMGVLFRHVQRNAVSSALYRYLFHYRKWSATLFISLIIFAILVSGCANNQLETYQELHGTALEQPAYYYTEVENKIADAESEPTVEPDPFLSEIEAKVLKYQKQWQAQLESETPMPNLFYDLSTDAMKAYRQLAASREAARTRLAEPITLELLVALGYEWSPGLKSIREKIRAVLEQYPQAAYLENVLRQYNAFTKQLGTKVGPMRHKEMVAMKFPFPGTLALKGADHY